MFLVKIIASFIMSNGNLQHLSLLGSARKRRASGFDSQLRPSTCETKRTIAQYCSGKKSGLNEYLESVTYPQHGFAVFSGFLDDSDAGTGSCYRAGSQIVAVAETTGQNVRVVVIAI